MTTISGLTTDAASTKATQQTLASDFNDFLTLLTTQLQNQDPLDPMDSSEFTNQLVQFSQVEQQINANQKLDSLLALQLSSSISAALGYVGLDASYVSNDVYFDGSDPMKITYSMAETSVKTTLNIYDSEGKKVYSESVDGDVGINEFTWDGKDEFGTTMPEGTYNIKIDALNGNDQAVSSTVVVQGNVRGIETQDGEILLLVGDRAVPISNVLNASVPDDADAEDTITDIVDDIVDNEITDPV
jgi:flagellar basal-body rod modification protein FlgD